MLKQLRKKIIVIVCFCVLLSPVAFADNNQKQKKPEKGFMEFVHKDIKVNDLDIEPIDTQKVKKNVVPDTKQEGKKVLHLFLKTMLGVLISAILVHIILIFVKKFYGSAFVNQDYEDYEELDLASPSTKQDALKSFLNRTK